MAENLGNALTITVVGMGLVFFGIVVLWGMMSVLMRVTSDPLPASQQGGEETEDVSISDEGEENNRLKPIVANDAEKKRRVAAVAVTVALSMRQKQPAEPVITNTMSAWQLNARQNPRGRR